MKTDLLAEPLDRNTDQERLAAADNVHKQKRSDDETYKLGDRIATRV